MLKNDKVTQASPTFQPHSEELKLGSVRFKTFDLGGHASARKIWKTYFPAVDGVVFIVDAEDTERFPEAKEELENILSTPELEKSPIVILGNKIDMKNAVSEEDLRAALGLVSNTTFG